MRMIFLLMIGILTAIGCSAEKESGNSEQMTSERAELPTGVLHYTAVEEWTAEHPSSSMRRGQFRMPGAEGKADAVLAVFNFPGTGGSVEANLQRWYGQMKQPDGSATADHVERKDVVVNGLPVAIVYVTGTYLESATGMMGGDITERENYAMLAAIAETAGSPWFFKATGPKETIDHHRQNFEEFVQTFRVVNQPPEVQ